MTIDFEQQVRKAVEQIKEVVKDQNMDVADEFFTAQRLGDVVHDLESVLADELTIRPTHKHKKHGTKYNLIGIGKIQAEYWEEREYCGGDDPCPGASIDMREVAIYRGIDGSLWVQPREEFKGQFEVISHTSEPDMNVEEMVMPDDLKHDR